MWDNTPNVIFLTKRGKMGGKASMYGITAFFKSGVLMTLILYDFAFLCRNLPFEVVKECAWVRIDTHNTARLPQF